MKPTKKTIAAVRRAVKQLGGGTGAAEKLGVHKSAVSHWESGRRAPTVADALALEKATSGTVKASEIRPELRQLSK